jgi:hypothetical protein
VHYRTLTPDFERSGRMETPLHPTAKPQLTLPMVPCKASCRRRYSDAPAEFSVTETSRSAESRRMFGRKTPDVWTSRQP